MPMISTLALVLLSHIPDHNLRSSDRARPWVAQADAADEETDGADDATLAPGRRVRDPSTVPQLEERRRGGASNSPPGRALDRIRRNVERQRRSGQPRNQAPSRSAPTRAAQASSSADEDDESIDFAQRARSGKFSFEFSKAEIMDVVKAVSDLTRRNFIVPEKIKSQRITILSPTKITSREAWSVFLAALEVNGITVVRSGKFYKLVEGQDAQKSPIPLCIGDDTECPKFTDYMVTYLMRLTHVDASQLNGIIKSMVSKQGQVTVFAPSNALVISDYAPNITRLRRIVAALDVAGGNDEIRIVQIQYATASEIAETVKQVFEVDAQPNNAAPGRRTPRPRAQGNAAGGDTGDESQAEVKISKIVPDDRTNQIIVRANQRSFDAISNLIGRIDVPVADGEQGKVHVYYLENASAEDLASTLSSLSSSTNQSNPSVNRGRRPNPAGNQPNQGPESAALFEGEVQVTAETSTNSLIIVASPRDFRSLRKIIDQLDLPRRQVYVEAAILEVTVGGDTEFGTNWHLPYSDQGFGEDVDGSESLGFIQGAPGGGTSPTLTPLTDPTSLLQITSGALIGLLGEGITVPVGDNDLTLPSFGVVLRALQSANNSQVLSTPHILTTDNEEATIEVGQRIPFQRGVAVPQVVGGAGGQAGAVGNQFGGLNNFASTDRIDVSLKLTLTPQINELDRIRMEIDQQIEDVIGVDGPTQQPITANRAAKTVVVVDDQQTVVLGGLIRDRTRETENKIPILGDLPILGWLFKSRTTETEKVNLVLVLTPYIIRDSSDFQRIFERKIREYEEFAEEFYGDTPEYRAYIDYERKSGPFAKLATQVMSRRSRIENGGDGGGEEQLIRPERTEVEFEPLMGDGVPGPERAPDGGDGFETGEQPDADDPGEE